MNAAVADLAATGTSRRVLLLFAALVVVVGAAVRPTARPIMARGVCR